MWNFHWKRKPTDWPKRFRTFKTILTPLGLANG